MESIKGVVEEVINSGSSGGNSIRVDGRKYWVYDNKALKEVHTGDSVSFRYKETVKGDITYKNVQGLITKLTSPVDGGSKAIAKTSYVPDAEKQRSIIRQNSVTNAVNFSAGYERSVEEVIDIARKFEAYSSGDLDKKELEETLEGMS